MAAAPRAVLLAILQGVIAVCATTTTTNHAFDAYILAQNRDYKPGSAEYTERRAIFEKRHAAIERQNAKPEGLWTAGVNHFTDRTEIELLAFRGYRRTGGSGSSSAGQGSWDTGPRSLAEEAAPPKDFDWMHLKTAKFVRDQLDCGSCWAVAATGILEAHHEIYFKEVKKFSAQELVECTPNPKKCGGHGGCSGATAEFAFHQALKYGIRSEEDFPYTGRDQETGRCPATSPSSLGSALMSNVLDGDDTQAVSTNGGAAIGLVGWKKLPQNEYEPLIRHLVRYGPVAVSISAENQFSYHGGILDSCKKDTVIDHAVALYGYGVEEKNTALVGTQGAKSIGGAKKYWLLRNSWGKQWGEKGYVRLLRHNTDTGEEAHCGQDNDPEAGSGCAGSNVKEITICGSCGILYDASIPIFTGSGAASDSLTTGSKATKATKPRGAKVLAVIGPDAKPSFVREDRKWAEPVALSMIP